MATHAKDSPSLSVQVDARPSSSPFPSPSSSFLPPPVPGSHEFAVKLPPRKTLKDTLVPPDASSAATASIAAMSQQHPQRSNGKPSPTQSTPTQTHSVVTNINGNTASPNSALTPTTPTGATSPATTTTTMTTTMTPPLPVPAPMTPTHTTTMLTAASPPTPSHLSHTHRDSLTSNRPAPPSPAVSRRASAAASTRSSRPPSTAAHRFSTASSLAPSTAPSIDLDAAAAPDDTSLDPLTPTPPAASALSTLTTPTASPTSAAAQAVPAPEPAAAATGRRSLLVKIRDFAFPSADARHRGQGTDAPRATRRLNRPASTWSASSRSSCSSVEDDSTNAPGSSTGGGGSGGGGGGGAWGGFRWGGLSLGWAGRAVDGPAGASSAGGGGPSPVDFARNFDVASPEREIADPYASFAFPSGSGSGSGSGPASGAASDDEADYFDAYDIEDDGEYADGDGGDADGEDGGVERPLLPGTYRALYAFEPEGTAEMALAEDQLVRVVGRGGGVGWAVVERARAEGGGHALVPEGYLEVVRLDGEGSE